MQPSSGDPNVDKRPKLIFYRASKFGLMGSGVVPYTTVGSCGADGDSLVWALLRDVTTLQEYFVVNTHLSNGISTACHAQREDEAFQIHNAIKAYDKAPVGAPTRRDPIILMGDFNTDNDSADTTLKSVGDPCTSSTHSYNLNPIPLLSNGEGTFNVDWTTPNSHPGNGKRFDYIWFSASQGCADPYRILGTFDISQSTFDVDYSLKTISGKQYTPSDHYPVTANFSVVK